MRLGDIAFHRNFTSRFAARATLSTRTALALGSTARSAGITTGTRNKSYNRQRKKGFQEMSHTE